MTMRTVNLAIAASLLSLVGTAHAAELISSPLWTDTGNAGICNIRNAGAIPITVQVKLFSNNGFHVDIDNCNAPSAPLGPGKTCSVFSFGLPDDSYVACSVKTSNVNASNIRGSIETRHSANAVSNGTVVLSGELR